MDQDGKNWYKTHLVFFKNKHIIRTNRLTYGPRPNGHWFRMGKYSTDLCLKFCREPLSNFGCDPFCIGAQILDCQSQILGDDEVNIIWKRILQRFPIQCQNSIGDDRDGGI